MLVDACLLADGMLLSLLLILGINEMFYRAFPFLSHSTPGLDKVLEVNLVKSIKEEPVVAGVVV